MLKLYFINGSLAGTEIELRAPGGLVGRNAANCAIVLKDTDGGVSGNHALLLSDDGMSWQVQDVGSRNGTLLNGIELSLAPVNLPKEGELCFGNIETRFHVEADRPNPPDKRGKSTRRADATLLYPIAAYDPPSPVTSLVDLEGMGGAQGAAHNDPVAGPNTPALGTRRSTENLRLPGKPAPSTQSLPHEQGHLGPPSGASGAGPGSDALYPESLQDLFPAEDPLDDSSEALFGAQWPDYGGHPGDHAHDPAIRRGARDGHPDATDGSSSEQYQKLRVAHEQLTQEKATLEAQYATLKRELEAARAELTSQQLELQRVRQEKAQIERKVHEDAGRMGRAGSSQTASTNTALQTIIDQSLIYTQRFGEALDTLADSLAASGQKEAGDKLLEATVSLTELRFLLAEGRRSC